MLKRIDVFTGFLENGRICLSNNVAERQLRRIDRLSEEVAYLAEPWPRRPPVKRRRTA